MSKPEENPAEPPRLRVRMYRQGLGDCFLLTFGGRVHVLIDCGVIVGTEAPKPIMNRVAEDIRTVTGGTVDLLVVTHEHWDHLSGFQQAREVFDQIRFKEIWMAWTEGNLPLAKRLRAERAKKTQAVENAARRLAASTDPYRQALGECLHGILGFAGVAPGAADGGRTGEIMAYLQRRGGERGCQLRYLRPGGPVFPLPGSDNVRVYVLGPPEDEKLLRRSDPSRTQGEVYLSLASAFLAAFPGTSPAERAAQEAAFPHPAAYRIPVLGGNPEDKVSPELSTLFRKYRDSGDAYRTIDEDWLTGAGTLALKLDQDTNNTSLVLAFEFIDTGEVLLFPGDAQVGNWLSWDLHRWTVADAQGRERTVRATDLLARTIFYKVGHHGSHNATLQERGLERMNSQDLVAMIPVDQAMAKKKKWQMPWHRLRARLDEKCACLVVQDEAEHAGRPNRGRLEVNESREGSPSLYVDYVL